MLRDLWICSHSPPLLLETRSGNRGLLQSHLITSFIPLPGATCGQIGFKLSALGTSEGPSSNFAKSAVLGGEGMSPAGLHSSSLEPPEPPKGADWAQAAGAGCAQGSADAQVHAGGSSALQVACERSPSSREHLGRASASSGFTMESRREMSPEADPSHHVIQQSRI